MKVDFNKKTEEYFMPEKKEVLSEKQAEAARREEET